MDDFCGPLTFSQMNSLRECIEQCKYIDNTRKILAGNSGYNRCFEICNNVVLNISRHFWVQEGIACHAMMIAQTFISSDNPGNHIKKSSIPGFGLFWCYVGVACFVLSVNFTEMKSPNVRELMAITLIPSCLYVKKEYKRVQMLILGAIKWKLHFPTAIDIVDRIELFVYLQTSLRVTMNQDAVNLIVCFAYKERDLLVHSSHCITVAAMAVEIRCKKHLSSFDEVFQMISPPSLKEEVSKCADVLYQKMMELDYFSGIAVQPDAMEIQ